MEDNNFEQKSLFDLPEAAGVKKALYAEKSMTVLEKWVKVLEKALSNLDNAVLWTDGCRTLYGEGMEAISEQTEILSGEAYAAMMEAYAAVSKLTYAIRRDITSLKVDEQKQARQIRSWERLGRYLNGERTEEETAIDDEVRAMLDPDYSVYLADKRRGIIPEDQSYEDYKANL